MTTEARRKNQSILICVVLAALVVTAFLPVTRFDFVRFDDNDFVTDNSHVQAGMTSAGIKWAFDIRTEVARNWHPITLLTHMLDCQLFGLKAGWHHFDNLLLHVINTLLVFLLLRTMTGAVWRSAMVAGLFGLHPLHVESVAWVAERKDVLSTMFWLLTTGAYWKWKMENGKWKMGWYFAALVFFALGLMSKPMLVTLPFTLLLLDYWPLRLIALGGKPNAAAVPVKGKKAASPLPPPRPTPSIGRLVAEKTPFFLLSAALCAITYWIQKQGGAMQSGENLPLNSRVGNALISYCRYIVNMFWPHDLAGLYLRHGDWPLWQVCLAGLFLGLTTVAAFAQIKRRPYFTIGWLWYIGTLVPVIGLVQVGMQAMADRFTYVPLIGLFIALVWGAAEFIEERRLPKSVPAAVMAISLLVCGVLTFHQVGYWKDSIILFKRMIEVSDQNYMAHYNLANMYSRDDQTDAAIAEYELALKAEPNYGDAHNNLAGMLLKKQRYDEAIEHYAKAFQILGGYLHQFNLANAYMTAGRTPEAEAAFRKAIQLNPQSYEAHNNFGTLLQSEKKDAEAIEEFQTALAAKPDLEVAHVSLGNVFSKLGRYDEAAANYKAAKELNPDRRESYNGLGIAYAMSGKMDLAAAAFKELVQHFPDDAAAYGNLGNALSAQDKTDEAIQYYQKALQLNPKDFQTEFNLGLTFSKQGKPAVAREHYQTAIQIKPDYTDAKNALKLLNAPSRPH